MGMDGQVGTTCPRQGAALDWRLQVGGFTSGTHAEPCLQVSHASPRAHDPDAPVNFGRAWQGRCAASVAIWAAFRHSDDRQRRLSCTLKFDLASLPCGRLGEKCTMDRIDPAHLTALTQARSIRDSSGTHPRSAARTAPTTRLAQSRDPQLWSRWLFARLALKRRTRRRPLLDQKDGSCTLCLLCKISAAIEP